MTDYFAVLRQPRQPQLDERALEQAFHAIARRLHPDAGETSGSEAFTELNRAFNTLRDPRLRLQHLLALERVDLQTAPVATDFADLFSRAANIATRAKGEIGTTEGSSAITQSVGKLRRSQLQKELMSVLDELRLSQNRARDDLALLNEQWHRDRVDARVAAAHLHQRFSFLQRWTTTLRELQFALQH